MVSMRAALPNWGLSDYRVSGKAMVKVLDFVQFGGPILTIDRTIFEMWLGAL